MTRSQKLFVLLAVAILACGCSSSRMQTPIVYQGGEIDPYAQLAPDERTASVEVFFATDRNAVESEDPDKRYGNKRGDVLRLGTAKVRVGAEELPWDEVHRKTLASEELPLTLLDVEEFGRLWTTIPGTDRENFEKARASTSMDDPVRAPARAFARAIDAQLERKEVKEILVFVPGYNTTFAKTIRMVSQLHHYGGREGVVIAFPWPAGGSVFDYVKDHGSGQISSRSLRQLLFFLAKETSARRINLLGYSAGAPVLSSALLQMRLMHAADSVEAMRASSKLGIVIYSSADEDLMHFRNLFLDDIDDIYEYIQVYVSPDDSSLSMATTFYHGYDRLGRSGEVLTESDKEALRTSQDSGFIDVSVAQNKAGRTSYGHMYWYQNSWVLSDLIIVLKHRLAPAERGLVRAEGEAMWSFPEDYPERVRKIVAALPSTRPAAK
ncbi:MAG: alpha/beta hydrolase [Planctomycetota bacterium]|jgi:esterase/lipase superfamily enzyme